MSKKHMPAAMRHRMLSLISRNYSELINASAPRARSETGPVGGDMCITSSLMLLCFAYKFHIIMHIVPASERAHWHYTIQHTFISCGSERTGELARTLALRFARLILLFVWLHGTWF